MIKYKIVEKNDDLLQATIERTGKAIRFKMVDVLANEAKYEEMIAECKRTVDTNTTLVEMIKTQYTCMTELSDEEKGAVYEYGRLMKETAPYYQKMVELQAILDEGVAERADIYKQIEELNGYNKTSEGK